MIRLRLNRIANTFTSRVNALNSQLVNNLLETTNGRLGEFIGPGRVFNDVAFVNQFNAANTGVAFVPGTGFVATTPSPLGDFSVAREQHRELSVLEPHHDGVVVLALGTRIRDRVGRQDDESDTVDHQGVGPRRLRGDLPRGDRGERLPHDAGAGAQRHESDPCPVEHHGLAVLHCQRVEVERSGEAERVYPPGASTGAASPPPVLIYRLNPPRPEVSRP